MKIGIIGKTNLQQTFDLTEELCGWLAEKGVEVYLEEDLAKKIKNQKSATHEEIAELVDIILVFGGDGTFLGVARIACKHGTPILGINLGGLGFLTEVTVDEIYAMASVLFQGIMRLRRERCSGPQSEEDKKLLIPMMS